MTPGSSGRKKRPGGLITPEKCVSAIKYNKKEFRYFTTYHQAPKALPSGMHPNMKTRL